MNEWKFKNRQEAGEQLSALLESKYKHLNPLIIGIPRGGIEVAWYVARCLQAALSVVVSKKLPLPDHPEYGIGAITEGDLVYISPEGKNLLPVQVLNQIIDEQRLEVIRRVKKYRHGKALPEMKGRTVILVDDGIATGATLVPVIKLCRKNKAAKIIIAAPVSGMHCDENLHEADHIEILIQPERFYAVGQVYEDFGEFTDEEVQKILLKAEGTAFEK